MKAAKDTEKQLEIAWNEVLEKDLYPTVTEFSKLSGVSKSSIYHNYEDWAEKIRERRDEKRGKRKTSRVTRKVSADIQILQKENRELFQANEELTKENKMLENKLSKYESELRDKEEIEKKYQLVLSGYDYLISQLQLAGVNQEKIKKIWKAFESNIVLE